MASPKFVLAAGCLLFAVIGLLRFSAQPTIASQRPLQLIAPVSARAVAPVKTAEKGVSGAPVAAAAKTKAAPPQPRRIVRVESPAARPVAVVPKVVAPKATPRVTPSAATPDYERRVADAASIGDKEPNRAVFRLEHIAAAEPGRPEAYETLAAIHLRQGDFYQAYEMFDSAIRNSGKATFSVMHDHARGNFDAGAKATCVGELTIQPSELAFEGADGHRFAVTWAELQEAGSNRFFGSGIGGFHVRVAADGKSRNFNLAPRSKDKREANLILDLLIENAQRQHSGK